MTEVIEETIPPTAGQQLIEEIDNFLKIVTNRQNIPATEIQNHLLDIRAIARTHTN